MVERGAVPALDVGLHLGAEAEPEPAPARLGQLPRRRRRHHRAAGERHRHAGQEVEVGGERRGRARKVGGATGLGDDEPVEPGGRRVPSEVLHATQREPARHEVELHGGDPTDHQ